MVARAARSPEGRRERGEGWGRGGREERRGEGREEGVWKRHEAGDGAHCGLGSGQGGGQGGGQGEGMRRRMADGVKEECLCACAPPAMHEQRNICSSLA